MRGHCYVATESLQQILGGIRNGWYRSYLEWEGEKDKHWFLYHKPHRIIVDPTADQFATELDYSAMKISPMQARFPSSRTICLLRRMQIEPNMQPGIAALEMNVRDHAVARSNRKVEREMEKLRARRKR